MIRLEIARGAITSAKIEIYDRNSKLLEMTKTYRGVALMGFEVKPIKSTRLLTGKIRSLSESNDQAV